MDVKRETSEDVYDVLLQRLSDKVKPGLAELQRPGVELHPLR